MMEPHKGLRMGVLGMPEIETMAATEEWGAGLEEEEEKTCSVARWPSEDGVAAADGRLALEPGSSSSGDELDILDGEDQQLWGTLAGEWGEGSEEEIEDGDANYTDGTIAGMHAGGDGGGDTGDMRTPVVRAQAPMDEVMPRMRLAVKAGMEGVDKARATQIIVDMSRGSRFYQNEERKAERTSARIRDMLAKARHIRAAATAGGDAAIEAGERLVQQQVQEVERCRRVDRVYCHVGTTFTPTNHYQQHQLDIGRRMHAHNYERIHAAHHT